MRTKLFRIGNPSAGDKAMHSEGLSPVLLRQMNVEVPVPCYAPSLDVSGGNVTDQTLTGHFVKTFVTFYLLPRWIGNARPTRLHVLIALHPLASKFCGRVMHDKWIPVNPITLVMKLAEALSEVRPCTAIHGAGVNLGLHREFTPSGVMRLGVVGVAAVLILLLSGSKQASANHAIYLPLAGQTWMAQQIKANQEQVWCVDARAANYPNFVSQLRDVNDQYTERVGIRHREVAFSEPACEIKHTMPDTFPCGDGAAACVYYANKPITIVYAFRLAYFDWRSTHGHELGHAILGQLHERYRDSGGSLGCGGTAEVGLTVMQCGPPYVRYPQSLDVSRGCAIILTSWCGQAPEPEPCGDPCWDGFFWLFADGWKFHPNEGCGEWTDPAGRLVWSACDMSWNGRFSPLLGVWLSAGSSFYDPAVGIWYGTP